MGLANANSRERRTTLTVNRDVYDNSYDSFAQYVQVLVWENEQQTLRIDKTPLGARMRSNNRELHHQELSKHAPANTWRDLYDAGATQRINFVKRNNRRHGVKIEPPQQLDNDPR